MLYTQEAVKLIYDWTKGSAYLIVIFCKHVIDYLNDNYTEKATKTIVQLVFEKEFIEKKEMFESDDFEPQIQDVANVGQEGDLVNTLNEELLKEIASATITSPQARINELYFFTKYDIVLIILWILASIKDPGYIPVVVNFLIFFLNDMYGFICWKKRETAQC